MKRNIETKLDIELSSSSQSKNKNPENSEEKGQNKETNFDIDLSISSPSKHNKVNNDHKVQTIFNKKSSKRVYGTEHLRDFTENTSLHGFKYLGEKNKYIDKIWWSVMIILALVICGILIKDLWKKWDDTPVIVSFSETKTPIWMIPFPAVTICSNIQIPRSRYNYTKKCEENDNMTREEITYHNSISLLCEMGNCINEKKEFINESVISDMFNVSEKQELFIICGWITGSVNCDELFTPILTDAGLCYTSNMFSHKELYEDDTLQNQYNFTNHKESYGWNYNEEHENDIFHYNEYPRRGTGVGVMSSLELIIKRNKNEFDAECGRLTGMKIAFHPPDVIPRVTEYFNWIPMNTDSIYSINPSIMRTSKMLKNYSSKKRQCYYPKEKKLKFFKNYNQENCELECLTNFTMAVCDCVSYSMPRNRNMSICSARRMDCVVFTQALIFSLKVISEIHKYENNSGLMKKNLEVLRECNCLSACTSIKYEVEVSQNNLNTDDILYFLTSQENNNTELLDVARLRMFFKESHFITTRRSELYGLVDFLANCGGLLGVCLGFSILSLVEIIYFLTLRLFHYVKRNRINASDTL